MDSAFGDPLVLLKQEWGLKIFGKQISSILILLCSHWSWIYCQSSRPSR